MSKYEARMDGGVSQALQSTTLPEAMAEAQLWVLDANWEWDLSECTTIWVRYYVYWTDEDGEEQNRWEKVGIDPPEPKCKSDDGHDWQSPHAIVGGIKENPGVYGHGGGVTIQSVCMRCGCGQLTDTWAQDPEDGEQGLESVRYQEGKYADHELIAQSDDETEE